MHKYTYKTSYIASYMLVAIMCLIIAKAQFLAGLIL